MKIYKFLIPSGKWVQDPDDPSTEWTGCIAAVIAENRTQAQEVLATYAAMNGLDSGWLRAAKVAEIPIVNGAVIAWAQVS